MVEISSKHPILAQHEFKPDLVSFNVAGDIQLWVECGQVSINKLEKMVRRLSYGKLIVLKSTEHEGKILRQHLEKNEVKYAEKIEILCFPQETFKEWLNTMEDSVEVYGEALDKEFNLVANATPFSFKFTNK